MSLFKDQPLRNVDFEQVSQNEDCESAISSPVVTKATSMGSPILLTVTIVISLICVFWVGKTYVPQSDEFCIARTSKYCKLLMKLPGYDLILMTS